MTNGQAMVIFENINSDQYSVEEKGWAIHQILSMATLNSVSKEKIKIAFIWLWHQHFQINDPIAIIGEGEE